MDARALLPLAAGGAVIAAPHLLAALGPAAAVGSGATTAAAAVPALAGAGALPAIADIASGAAGLPALPPLPPGAASAARGSSVDKALERAFLGLLTGQIASGLFGGNQPPVPAPSVVAPPSGGGGGSFTPTALAQLQALQQLALARRRGLGTTFV